VTLVETGGLDRERAPEAAGDAVFDRNASLCTPRSGPVRDRTLRLEDKPDGPVANAEFSVEIVVVDRILAGVVVGSSLDS
jgi:hypothetical protein